MDFDTQIKLAIYRHFAETGRGLLAAEAARLVGSDIESVLDSYSRLRAQRVLALAADGVSIRMAPPFSGVPTQHIVIVDGKQYFANCAWDALGVPAALHQPGVVHSRCKQSGEPLKLVIGPDGPEPSDWLFHSWYPQPSGGTILFSPEETCSSSGRKNGFARGAQTMNSRCDHS